ESRISTVMINNHDLRLICIARMDILTQLTGTGAVSNQKARFTGSADGRGPRRGSPAGVLDSSALSAKRERINRYSFLWYLVKTLRLRRDADGTSALSAISGIIFSRSEE